MKIRSTIRPLFAALLLVSASGWIYGQRPTSAKQLVEQTIDAIGGEQALRSLSALKLTGFTATNHLQDSEHPDGPWLLDVGSYTEIRDLRHKRLKQITTQSLTLDNNIYKTTQVIADGVAAVTYQYGGQINTQAAPAGNEWFDYSLQNIVLTALNATDLHTEPDINVNGIPEHVIVFTMGKIPVRMFLNGYNHFPVAIEYIQAFPSSIAQGIWGDVTLRTTYSNWELENGGVHYPLQSNVTWDGSPYRIVVVKNVEVNPTIDEHEFGISAESRAQAQKAIATADDYPLGDQKRPAAEIAPNVIQIPGSWFVTIVRQPDGIVIIDAPISSGYSKKVLAEAERRFPGVPVKAVISSSNYWWHFAGLREYVARGIPVYGLDVNHELLEKVINKPHRLYPDDLYHHPHKMDFHSVSGKTLIGSGPNRLEVYPIRTSTTSQMLMVYFPEHHILFSSDMAQPLGPGGSFLAPQYLWDLKRAVDANSLKVDKLIGLHMSPTDWSKLEETVKAAVAPPEAK